MNVNNQKHYMIEIDGKKINTIKIIDAVLENLGVEGKEAFHVGNVLKYVIRYKHKGDQEDLQKAIVYLEYILGIKPQGEREKAFKEELKRLDILNEELENMIFNKDTKFYNLQIDFELLEKEKADLIQHIEYLNEVIAEKDNIIYDLTR